MEFSELVDCNILTKVWPIQLVNNRVCVICKDNTGMVTSVTIYTPVNSNLSKGPIWTGGQSNDIVLNLQNNHFTLTNISCCTDYIRPIEKIIEPMEALNIFHIVRTFVHARGDVYA